MDNTEAAAKRNWNQDVFDLYDAALREGQQKWKETQKTRLKNTRPSLKLSAYAGKYRSETIGDISLEESGHKLILKTRLIDIEMQHWHLDTYLVEHEPWQMRIFADFNIGPDGNITSVGLFGDQFSRVEEDPGSE